MKSKYIFNIAGKKYNKTQAITLASDLIARNDVKRELNQTDTKIASSFYHLRFGFPPTPDTVFFVDSDGYGYKCIKFMNKNGVDHFSTRKALNSDFANQKRNRLAAFRQVVDDQINPLRRWGCHVDHVIPFHVLLSDFLNDNNIKLFDVEIKPNEEAARPGMHDLIDKSLEKKWYKYHKAHAKLRTIDATDNLQKGARLDMPLYRYRKERGETYD